MIAVQFEFARWAKGTTWTIRPSDSDPAFAELP